MKKRILVTLLFILLVAVAASQTWIRSVSFSGIYPPGTASRSERLLCNVIPAIGGGYLLQGYLSVTSNDGLVELYSGNVFWKYNENGEVIWRRTGGGGTPFKSIVSNGIDRYYCVKTNSGYAYLSVYDSELNSVGFYGFTSVNGYSASLYDMQYVDDGLVFAGQVTGSAVVIKTDFQFNVLWQSDSFWTMGQARSVEPFENGWISLSNRVFTEINAIGDTLWTYYDSINNTGFYDCTVSADNSIYLLGLYKLWKVDTNEHTLELVAANTPGFDTYLNGAIDILPNGNIVYTGRSSTNQILHSYSPDGVLQWSRSYDTLGAIYFGTGSKNLLVMPDGSILFCMYYNGYILVKTDSNGNVVANDDPIAPIPVTSINCYPQPASSRVMISVKSDLVGDLGYSIFNIRGQRIYSGKINGLNKELSFELPSEALERMTSGVYLLSLDNGNKKVATTKLVLMK